MEECVCASVRVQPCVLVCIGMQALLVFNNSMERKVHKNLSSIHGYDFPKKAEVRTIERFFIALRHRAAARDLFLSSVRITCRSHSHPELARGTKASFMTSTSRPPSRCPSLLSLLTVCGTIQAMQAEVTAKKARTKITKENRAQALRATRPRVGHRVKVGVRS